MAVKIRLRLQGKRNRPFYRIVVADTRVPRDGKYLEMLGWYNPFEDENKTSLNAERFDYWLSVGAMISPKVKSIAKNFKAQVEKA